MAMIFLTVVGAILATVPFVLPYFFRVVVPTNEVHIVQSGGATRSFGRSTSNGNAYYAWPSWIPKLGVTTIVLPTSNFDIDLKSYEAYDSGKLPFVVDVKAFFRIEKSDDAAERVSSFEEMKGQLVAIVQGSIRTILAKSDIESIMQGRGEFGDMFTAEVNEQLSNWGVVPVRNIELMDIRDAEGSDVISNIMAKKKSQIARESRETVAENNRAAEIAEIAAERETQLQREQAKQVVGIREAERMQAVGMAEEVAAQQIAEQAKVTAERRMDVLRVEQGKAAEIAKEVAVIQAQQNSDTQRIEAEGALEAERCVAEGIQVKGAAEAAALKDRELAPIHAQIELAREIGNNPSYQQYLIALRAVEAQQIIGSAQAAALEKADVKVIANAGDTSSGVSNVMDLFTSKGGTHLAGMLEALNQSGVGKDLVNRFTKGGANSALGTAVTAATAAAVASAVGSDSPSSPA
jgi:flotillin